MGERVKKFDYLRCFACMAVVLLHVSSSYWSCIDINSFDFGVMTVYNAVSRFAVPVFMMLSGLFLLSPQKEMSGKSIWKRILRLVIAFYVWSAFYAFQGLAVKAVTGQGVTTQLWKASLERFLWGHYHMWFIFLILGFYVLLPIVRKLCESKTIIEYYLILWFATAYVIPALAPVIGVDWLSAWVQKLSMNMLIGYLGYFILGYYIKTFGFSKPVRMFVYVAGVAGFLYTAVGTIMLCRSKGIASEELLGPGTWNVLCYAAAVFTLFTYAGEMKRGYRLVKSLAKCSLVIYLIHPFFLEKLNLLGVTTISFSAIISVPVLTLIILVASYLVAFILSKIPYVNKICV